MPSAAGHALPLLLLLLLLLRLCHLLHALLQQLWVLLVGHQQASHSTTCGAQYIDPA
jgi:hypothetical protein